MPPTDVSFGRPNGSQWNSASQGCYFYHIPKTAGMSTWQLLDWAYPSEKIFGGWLWEDLIRTPAETLAQYDAFRGHFLAYLSPFLGRPLRTFTILRDPVERTISHYAHVRRAPEHPHHVLANQLSLQQFCLDSRTRPMVENYQSGYLACPGGREPRQVANGMTEEDFQTYRLQSTLEPSPADYPPAGQLYEAAERRLASFAAVGVTERLTESLQHIASVMGWGTPPVLPRVNVNPYRPRVKDLDPETLRLIRELTEVDRALHRKYRRMLESGPLSLPEASAGDLAYAPGASTRLNRLQS